jgi:deoxyribodipyrimidine photolyase-related protein
MSKTRHSHFGRALRQLQRALPQTHTRRWVFVPYDQLTCAVGPLQSIAPRDLGIILIETLWKPQQRAYHKQKLALILANQRHFALEQARRGVAVRYVASTKSYGAVLAELRRELGDILCMVPAERELRLDVADHVTFVPHAGWLSTAEDFATVRGPPWRMDAFYRHMRKKTGFLMDGTQPRGGKWSHDAENRRRWDGDPPAPSHPQFKADAITREAADFVAEHFAHHYGTLDLATLPATAADAKALWEWAKASCLPQFGPYEDAMSVASSNVFHTRISCLVNLHRLLPAQVVVDALHSDIPLASLEGFVRQILGWREFMQHVHRVTDGLRQVPTHNALGAELPLPDVYWGKARSGLKCLDSVVADVWREGYSHHITRLMVLSNIATLVGISPRELTDWFWVGYVDAYDWVVEPNVLGMGTYALGNLFVTKPYVSGAAYINKMSDYCRHCAFNPKTTCPITPMYWAFLARHQKLFKANPRMGIPLMGLVRRSAEKKALDSRTAQWVADSLGSNTVLLPENLPT